MRSKEPGYICTYDDYGEDRYATLNEPFEDDFTPVPARILHSEDVARAHLILRRRRRCRPAMLRPRSASTRSPRHPGVNPSI